MPKSIRLETDTLSAHSDGRLPILDIEMWMDEKEGNINLSFYAKPMASRDIIIATSAFPLTDKKNIKAILVTSNSFPQPSCGRKYYQWTAFGIDCRERCYRENVGYAARFRRWWSRGLRKRRLKIWYTLGRVPTASPPGPSPTTETMAKTSDRDKA